MKIDIRFQDRICGATNATNVDNPPVQPNINASSDATPARPARSPANCRPGLASCTKQTSSSQRNPSPATIPSPVFAAASVGGNFSSYFFRTLASSPIRCCSIGSTSCANLRPYSSDSNGARLGTASLRPCFAEYTSDGAAVTSESARIVPATAPPSSTGRQLRRPTPRTTAPPATSTIVNAG